MHENLVLELQRKDAFVSECGNCKAKAYAETEYPLDVPVLCNLCASQFTAKIEQDPDTLLLFDMPNDVKARMIDIAFEQRLPVEEVYKQFLQWKLGRSTRADLYHKPEKGKTKE
jgi:hypothetical protein